MSVKKLNPNEFEHDLSESITRASMRAAIDLFRIVSSGNNSNENLSRLQYYQTVLPKLKDLAETMKIELSTLEQKLIPSEISTSANNISNNIPQLCSPPQPVNTQNTIQTQLSENEYYGLRHYMLVRGIPHNSYVNFIQLARENTILLNNSKKSHRGYQYKNTPLVREAIDGIIQVYNSKRKNNVSVPKTDKLNEQKNTQKEGIDISTIDKKTNDGIRAPYSVVRISERVNVPEQFLIGSENLLDVQTGNAGEKTYRPENLPLLVDKWNGEEGNKYRLKQPNEPIR